MPSFADRVRERSTTTGTGTLTLAGAPAGYQTFSAAFGNAASVYYTIAVSSDWEVGIGTTGAGTLSRDTVLSSSNGGSLVNFSAGTKDVFCSYSAGRAVTTSDAATLTNKTIDGASNTLSSIGNASLTNSTVTVNGTSVALGASGTVTAAAGTLTGATLASGVTASSLTSVGTLATLTVTAAIVGSVTGSSGSTTGNAATATALATARAINGTNFDGTAAITVTAAAGTLTGATLASGVTGSSLTSVGTLTALTMGGAVSMADNVIGRPQFTDYAETYSAPTISSGTLTLNIENGNVFRAALNANITTLTISNPSGTGNACSFTLIFNADGTARTVTWPAAVKWPGGTAPTLTSTSSRSDVFVFYTNTAGTTWYAMTAAQNFVTT